MVECEVTLCYNDQTPEALLSGGTYRKTKMESAESCGAAMRLKIFIAVLVLIGHAGRGGSSVWAVAGETAKDIEAVQLPAEQAQSLVDAGAGVTVLRRFLVFEGSATDAEIPESDPIPQEACSGDYLYGYSDLDVPIPTDGGWDGSAITLSGVSPDAEVMCVDVHYEINHHYYSALVVELTDEDYDSAHTLYDDYYTGDGNINETEHGITKFDGRNPNQEWVLWVQNGGPMYGGRIDSWWIKVYYYEPFYCNATSANCSWEYIGNVQVGDISNATDCNYYGDYTSMSTAMDVGTGYPITVTNGEPYDENDECGIWIDWNQDGDFNDVSETISVSGSPGEGPYTATITPPPTAANGDTRLRIRISAGPAGPCGEYDYGEVEDYTISVTGGAMGQIHGRKFQDINGNGTQDANEPGLEGWEIYIDVNENGQHDIGEPNAITDSIGYYELLDLAAGTYTVAEVLQVDWDQTFPGGDGTHTVVLSPGELAENINFGNRIPVAYGGGSGTAEDPYLIYTPEQMQAIGAAPNDWNKHFRLMADISLSAYTGMTFNIIGDRPFNPYSDGPFTGVFDGNGHTISNFSYSSNGGRSYIAIFGYVYGNGRIKDLGLISPHIYRFGDTDYAGPLVGELGHGVVTGCWVEGGTVEGDSYVGGLVGYNSYGAIALCYSTCGVSGISQVGGLVGRNEFATISSCYSRGSVSCASGIVGGLVGNTWGGGIEYCYSTGGVSGGGTTGGLVGNNIDDFTSIWDCFWDVNSSGQATSDGGTGVTTGQMQDTNTFLGSGWDFVDEYENGPSDEWAEPVGGGYPILWWQLDPQPSLPGFAGGTGKVGDPYLISKPSELNHIGHNQRLMENYFKMTNDIDLADVNVFIIGNKVFPFAGSFNGGNHSISDFSYSSQGIEMWAVGLFRYVDGPNAQIKNLRLINPNVNVFLSLAVGSLVGGLMDGEVLNCHAEDANIVSGYNFVGGLIGGNAGGDISECSSTGTVSGDSAVGGLAGTDELFSSVSNSYSKASVFGTSSVGGLVGRVFYGSVADSYAGGDVLSSEDDGGGLVGQNVRGVILNCYSSAHVSGPNDVGGMIGEDVTGDYTACFWDSNVNPDVNGIGNANGPNVIGLTTAQMQTESTFTDAGWDFVGEVTNGPNDVWDICEGTGYPKLAWSIPKADFACPDGVDGIDLGLLCEEWLLEELSADLWPEGGDGFVDFFDWAIFADGWGVTVDYDDLAGFAEQWLKSGSNYLMTDIAPGSNGDGITNGVDFAALADNWLAGI